jgi:anaerobic magnesium-protoporphyrin IX monomethyl ester cyclase
MKRKNGVDVLLIHPGNRGQVYQNLGNELSAIEPPIWAGLVATYTRSQGHGVMILDANADGLDPAAVAERVAEINPVLSVVVAYGQNPCASTMAMPAVGSICTEIKKATPEQKILLIGGHVAALPMRTLQEEEADFVCDGEGVYTTLQLLETLKNGGDLDSVQSLVYRGDGCVIQTPPARLVSDLDMEMPGIAWDLLPMDKYRAHNWHCFTHIGDRQPYASLYTALGCPFHCDFCCIQAPFKRGELAMGNPSKLNTYRLWAPESVIHQLDVLVNQYGVKNIKIADEIFVLDEKHVNRICDLIIERGYELNIWAYGRVDSWNDRMLEKMKRAGFNWLCFGFESGSRRVRDDVHKGYKQEQLFPAMEAARRHGIYVIGNYLFGLPEEDHESMQETLGLAMELNCEFANFYCAMAYPGSKLYDKAVADKLPLPDSWTGYSQHSYDSLPLPTRHLSGEEVLAFRDRAFQAYFRNPQYIDMIKKTFGISIVRHIEMMTSQKLERKHTVNG